MSAFPAYTMHGFSFSSEKKKKKMMKMMMMMNLYILQ